MLCACVPVVLEDGEGEAYDKAVERMARLRVAAVAQFQLGQPSLPADGQLLACHLAFVLQGLQGGVACQQFLAQRAEVIGQGHGGIVGQA